MILDPVAAYAIKTFDIDKGGKVFINVCTDQQIAAPETLDVNEIETQVVQGKDWIVPIVVSSGRQSTDKAGQPCFVVDCCMNPGVVLLGIENPSVKVLTVETCIELVEDRFSKHLSRDYKFPKMKSKGPLEQFEVKDPQDIGSKNTPASEELKSARPSEIADDSTQLKIPQSNKPNLQSKIEVVDSSQESSNWYFHIYRGNYSGTAQKKPSHVLEISGEHHNLKLMESTITDGKEKLDLKYTPSHVDAFYCSDEDTTYVMLWQS